MNRLDDSLHSDEPLRAGLLRVADVLIKNAAARMVHPTNNLGDDVHLVRVTTKRLRALLRLIRPVISKTVFDRENTRLRRGAKRLAPARDLDIARLMLAKLSHSNGEERDAMGVVIAGSGSDGDSKDEINKVLGQTVRDLESTKRNLQRIQISGHEWKTIGPGLRNVYKQCRKRMKKALRQHDDEAFHQWRIRVKNLYYELQILQPAWPERLNEMIEKLKKLEKQIGADHDLVILKRSLQITPYAFGNAKAIEQVFDRLEKKSRRLRQSTEPLGQLIFHQKPGRFVVEFGRHWNKWRSRYAGSG
jgi:CHAD domain-containing protein